MEAPTTVLTTYLFELTKEEALFLHALGTVEVQELAECYEELEKVFSLLQVEEWEFDAMFGTRLWVTLAEENKKNIKDVEYFLRQLFLASEKNNVALFLRDYISFLERKFRMEDYLDSLEQS